MAQQAKFSIVTKIVDELKVTVSRILNGRQSAVRISDKIFVRASDAVKEPDDCFITHSEFHSSNEVNSLTDGGLLCDLNTLFPKMLRERGFPPVKITGERRAMTLDSARFAPAF